MEYIAIVTKNLPRPVFKMKKILFILLIFLNLISSKLFASKSCHIPYFEQQKLLNLTYQLFDQTPGEGWRKISDLKCYIQSAQLIDEYIALHKLSLLDWEARNLTWHSGQLHAFAESYDDAKLRFSSSINLDEHEDTKILWNNYVYATISFLNKDLAELTKNRDKIANGPDFDGIKMNLNIVNNLIKCFNYPYKIAYIGCDHQERSNNILRL